MWQPSPMIETRAGRWVRRLFRTVGLLLLLAGIISIPAPLFAASFGGVGLEIEPGIVSTGLSVEDISTDGRVVVGTAQGPVGRGGVSEAFTWTAEDGLRWLPGTPRPGQEGTPFVSGPVNSRSGRAIAVSADGSVIVGIDSNGTRSALIWRDGGSSELAGANLFEMTPLAVSDDGTATAGLADAPFSQYMWTQRGLGEATALRLDRSFGDPAPASWETRGRVTAISATGDFWAATGAHYYEENGEARSLAGALRWSESEGFEFLPDPNGDLGGTVAGISADGSIVLVNSDDGAYFWDAATNASTRLPGLGTLTFEAVDMSADQSVVVGHASQGMSNAMVIWDAASGAQLLLPLLAGANGDDITLWSDLTVKAISGDGKTLVGNGINPDGVREGWVAVIPEPSVTMLLGLGLVGLCRFNRSGPGGARRSIRR